MAKVMIISLGTGRGVENGVAKSIHVNNPDKIFFIATNESKSTIERIESVSGKKLVYEPPLIIDNAEDVEGCWQTTARLVRSLIRDGYCSEDICIDFTSGTKAMSSGCVLAGASFECGNLSYVGGGKRDINGRVISGTERVIILTPNEFFIDQRRRMIQDFFILFQFDACIKLISDARLKSMAMEVHDELDLLEKLVLAYSFWDKFNHLKAASYFNQLHGKFDIRWQIDTSNSKEIVFKIANQKEKFAHSREILDKFSKEILADLLANADRRAQEGKYDDAVARLYRAVEVISQMLLARRKIDTSRVKIEDLPSSWQEEYRESNESIKLGQEKAFSLLESLDEDIGRDYRENKNLRNYLSKRNSSILAHGLTPMTKPIFDELSRETNQLADKAFPHLGSLKEKSRFPVLKLV
ncbi:MAG: TIGR02710 family CRISPR-associated protein [Methanosarcinales archaeon]|nr:TIGR02710 family CRISPR-associated protein [Methanosarcinales archaeon]